MPSTKPTLAIVGTFDELCGIAAYVKTMTRLLGDDFDIKVFDLDQFIFKNRSPAVQRLAESEIDEICQRLPEFDAVNIQLEHGLFGVNSRTILRRLKKVVRACRNLTITFHTIPHDDAQPYRSLLKSVLRGRVKTGWNLFRKLRQDQILSTRFYRFLRSEQSRRTISIVVHTRRDGRAMRIVHGLANVHDHPLAQIRPHEAELISSRAKRSVFAGLEVIPADAILLGCFGFLSPYKGVDVAIRALALLPSNYHLAIFGATHPGGLKSDSKTDPYISKLLRLIRAGKRLLASEGKPRLSVAVDGKDLPNLAVARHPEDLADRVHFLGALSDEDFPTAIAVCDTVLLPYREVGQSSSGPLCLGIELGKHVIASRTRAFLQALRYYRNRFRTFDIGNHVELSQAIRAESGRFREFPLPEEWNADSNRELYISLLSGKRGSAERRGELRVT